MTKKEYKDFIVWLIKPAIDAFKEGLKERDIIAIVTVAYAIFAAVCIVTALITKSEIVMTIILSSVVIVVFLVIAIAILQIKYKEYLDGKGEGE